MTEAATRTGERMSADDRRHQVVGIAREEFAVHGLHGTSTQRIADRAGVSQPYLFRLFGTKKELFVACVEAGFAHVEDLFRDAAASAGDEGPLSAMGNAYVALLHDRTELLAQMQAYAACDDEEIRAAVRRGFAELYTAVAEASGASQDELRAFFSFGMLLNVVAAMDLPALGEEWARDLVKGCLS